jgi:hypothetical protein
MRFEYHPDLVEQTVFQAARRDARLECELHATIDRLYEIPDQELRQRSFNEAYGDLFGRWKLDGILREAAREFPPVDRGVDKCVVAPAARGKTQAVDLFVKQADASGNEPTRTLLIQLCPEAFLRTDQTSAWLRRELYHVADMLDADFGYSPEDLGGSSWEGNLLRDRYQVLWRIYVVGRLIRSGQADGVELPSLKGGFRRAFAHHGLGPSDEDFAHILSQPKLTHHQLSTWASHPELVISASAERPADGTFPQRLGDACPLCGFPTYDWYVFSTEGDEKRAAAIETVKPSWRRDLGACRQCVETYASVLDRDFVKATTSITPAGGKVSEQGQIQTGVIVA